MMADKIPHDDLFEGPSMTFGEHLEELRVCLFRAVIGVVIGVLIGLVIANYVVRFFQAPLENAMREYYLSTSAKELTLEYPNGLPQEIADMILVRQLLPERVPVDVGQFAQTINRQFPGSLETKAFSSYFYSEEDFVGEKPADRPANVRGLCEALAAGATNEKSPAGEIWKVLNEDDQKELAELAELTDWKPADSQRFFHILDRAVENPQLHESPELTTQRRRALSDATGTVRPEPPFAPGTELDLTRQQNKRSLQSAFDSYLRAPAISTLKIWQWKPVRIKFQVLSAEESFMIWMKAGIVSGIAIASPWIFYQVWLFVAAGLYRHEKNYIYLYLPVSMALFLAGASLAFFFVFEPVLSFLFSFQSEMNADFEPRIGEWMSFVLILPLGFGISFQLPLVMLFLNRVGLVDITFYITNWRIAILTIFVVAMVLTPADPVSMLLMAVPLCFLYVLGIGMCKWMPRGRSPFQAAYEP
jgi:sec-independent protein translocase protein TatC